MHISIVFDNAKVGNRKEKSKLIVVKVFNNPLSILQNTIV